MTNRRNQQRAIMGLGVLAGAALVGAYAANRRRVYTRTGAPPMIHWERARRIAVQMNPETGATAEWHASWAAYYTDLVRRCEPLITEVMGQPLPQPVQEIAAFSRAEWVDANIRNFQLLFAPLEDLHRSSFRSDNLFAATTETIEALGPFDRMLIDPPRDGAIAVVKGLPPTGGPRRIVYVSCNPATLARDESVLVAERGYTLAAAGVVNMFPHTAHVESIAVFER